MPNPPNVDGLPGWLQITATLAFLLLTIIAALIGYRRTEAREPSGAAQTVLASIPDMSAVRQLTDQCRVLAGNVESLDATIRDHTHYLRSKIEVDRELCGRLREARESADELTDALARRPRRR